MFRLAENGKVTWMASPAGDGEIALVRTGSRIAAVQYAAMRQNVFERRGISAVTVFAADAVAAVGGEVPVVQVSARGLGLGIGEVTIRTRARLSGG